ncbi:MAG: hypothetical protein R2707_04670 [Acidimicrobiales bacterium]
MVDAPMLPTHDNAIAVGSGHTTAAGTMKTSPGTPAGWSTHIARMNTIGPTAPRSVKKASTRSPSLTKSHPSRTTNSTPATITNASTSHRPRTASSVTRNERCAAQKLGKKTAAAPVHRSGR